MSEFQILTVKFECRVFVFQSVFSYRKYETCLCPVHAMYFVFFLFFKLWFPRCDTCAEKVHPRVAQNANPSILSHLSFSECDALGGGNRRRVVVRYDYWIRR